MTRVLYKRVPLLRTLAGSESNLSHQRSDMTEVFAKQLHLYEGTFQRYSGAVDHARSTTNMEKLEKVDAKYSGVILAQNFDTIRGLNSLSEKTAPP